MLKRIFDTLFFTTLIRFIEVFGHFLMRSSLRVPPQNFSWVEVGTFAHLDFFFLFNNFVVELLLSFGSVSCCKAQFQSSCRCWTNGIVFDSSILWYTEEFMYMLHSWYEVLVLICCFFFDKCGAVHFSQTFPFVSLSKGPCSRTVVVCSDATLQMVTVLLCSFNREESFLW